MRFPFTKREFIAWLHEHEHEKVYHGLRHGRHYCYCPLARYGRTVFLGKRIEVAAEAGDERLDVFERHEWGICEESFPLPPWALKLYRKVDDLALGNEHLRIRDIMPNLQEAGVI